MSKYQMAIFVLALLAGVLARVIGLLWPHSPVGAFSNRIYHAMASALKSITNGALRLGKYIGQKKR